MAPPESELLQGTLDLLILKSLALEELHGMGISRRIARITHPVPLRSRLVLCFPPCTGWRKRVGSGLSGANRRPTDVPNFIA